MTASCGGISLQCHFAAAAISPILRRVLLEDGTLLKLENSEEYSLLAGQPSDSIAKATMYRSGHRMLSAR
jgi:hypothetical protein